MSAAAMKSTPAKTKVTKLISILEKDLVEKEMYNQSLEAQVRVLNDLVRSMAGEVVDREAVSDSLKQQVNENDVVITSLKEEVAKYKKEMSILIHKNNLLHLSNAMDLTMGECYTSEDSFVETQGVPEAGGATGDLRSLEIKNVKKVNAAVRHNKKDIKFVKRMSEVLSRLERKYAVPPERRKPSRYRRKVQLSSVIPKEFEELYKNLAVPLQDPVIPPEPYPKVDWSQVRFKPSLPKPDVCTIYGVHKDPEFYAEKAKAGGYNFYKVNPFGTLPGYYTTQGVVAMPSTPVGGYTYCVKARRWVLHASSTTEGDKARRVDRGLLDKGGNFFSKKKKEEPRRSIPNHLFGTMCFG